MLTRIWTTTIILSAAASLVTWACVAAHARGIRPLRAIARFAQKLSLAGVIVFGLMAAPLYRAGSTKVGGGTNNVPQMVPGLGEGVSLTGFTGSAGLIGVGNLVNPLNSVQGPITSTNTTRTLEAVDFERGFVKTRVGTSEEFDFVPIPSATIVSDWCSFGSETDWIYAVFTNWAFRVATNYVSRLRIYSFGKIEPQIREVNGAIATNNWFAPFVTSLGIVPQANWSRLNESDRPSQVWYAITPEGSLLITWHNALLDRDTNKPISFGMEFKTDGQFIYRYDLSRLNVDAVTNILAGASFGGNEWTTNALPTNVTSMAFYPLLDSDAYNQDPDNDGLLTIDELFFYNTDPHNADTDYDGLNDGEELLVYVTDPLDPHSVSADYLDGVAVKLGDLDPFSFPEGSTNTVLEHIFYSGTTNGVIVYPQSSIDTAVLEISVSGTGTGRLVVGDAVVPLVAPPQMRSGVITNTLLLEVGRGVRKEVWFTKPDGLDVELRSDDLLIGRMPTFYWPHGWLAFPHTEATVPCIHDFYSKGRVVSLVHGEEFPGLAATWSSEAQGVAITNVPPVSAEIHGSFPKSQERSISYTISHPDYICGVTNFAQTLRFCPQFANEPEPDLGEGGSAGDDGSPEYWSCDCSLSGACNCCSGEWCHCYCWDCPCNANQSPTLGGDDDEAEESFTNIVGGTMTPLAHVLYLYRANTNLEHLVVPSGSRSRCCPCPDHWQTNYVAKAFCSRRLAVNYAADGEEFRLSHDPCDVTISGVSPSRSFADSSVLFVTNGATYAKHDCTVLGVAFESEGGRPDISEYNRRSPSFGYPAAVCTNLGTAASIAFVSDVLLGEGFVRVSMEDVSGDIALWLPEWWDSHGTWHPAEPLLQSGGARARHLTLRRWRSLIGRYCDSRRLHVRIVSPRPSRCKVRFEFASSNGAACVYDHAEQRISTVKPPLLADYDWNFSANVNDALEQGNGRILYFWTNHDTWRGDDAFSQYSEGMHLHPTTLPDNGDDLVVNGRNDLVNLCPLAVDLSRFVSEWGTSEVRYVFYTGSPGNIRFVPVRTEWGKLDGIVKEEQKTVFDDDLHSSALTATSREGYQEVGYELPPELLALGSSGAGVIAAEFATEGWHTLRIAIKDAENGFVLFDSPVSVRALDVHRMYRWLNLDYVCNATTDPKYSDRLAVDWPDTEHADANVVFVHGYNMHPSEAWDWSQAMFKRLRWSGMDAGFTAVLWRGNESQAWVPKVPFVTEDNGYATRNYHQNVLNAFRTASAFASRVNSLPGARKYMIAHSLGNMLVSAARQDHGLQYDKYFMLNAAVPVEAYDPVDGVTSDSYHDMTPAEWRPYEDRVRSTHWYELFLSSPNDERSKLTWKGRFKDVDNTINFYSSKDEVVANGNDDVDELLSRKFAWYNQEQAKGSILVSFNPQAGWEFGNHYIKEVQEEGLNGETYYTYPKYTPEEASVIADTNLMARPFFKDFRDEQIYGEVGSAFLQANDMVRWYALSHGIPAESFAAGANPVPKWGTGGRNIDMAKECKPKRLMGDIDDGENDEQEESNWIHSYFIRISLFGTQGLFERMVEAINSTFEE